MSRLLRAAQLGAVTSFGLIRMTLRRLDRALRRDRRGGEVWRTDLPLLLARLGPTFVKFGQLASTRRDLLSPDWCQALSTLTTQAPAPPVTEVAAVLGVAEPSAPPPGFASFEWTPFASGSIATVHRAVLPDGRRVAVKVRRFGIERVMRADLALMMGVSNVLRRIPPLRNVPVREMTTQISDAVLRQLDFVAERDSLRKLGAAFTDDAAVRIPAIVEELCTPDVVVMEYIPDLVVYRPEGLNADQRRTVVEQTLRTVYRMLFLDGTVHCDLHPGNLYLQPDGSLVILDAGFVVELPQRVRRLFAAFFLNMALGRGERCADIVIESAAVIGDRADLAGLRVALTELVASVSGVRSQDFELGDFGAKLFLLQRRFGVYAAAEFVFPLLCLLVIEGMVKDFDSGVDFQALAVPVLLEALVTRGAGPVAS
ncbi:MAG TPA: AarF/UbiB family protein [Micromonosporaceae bacterium]|nr:AarF/UbiB family protein [Micromonosporaceae bacterium]